MFIKILGLVSSILFISISEQIILFPSQIIKNNSLKHNLRDIYMNYFNFIYQKCFSKIYYNKLININTNKINIFIANHLSTIDFCIVLSYLKLYQTPVYFISKKEMRLMPILGLTINLYNDIKINRNYEKDKEIITKQLKKIEKGIIFIFPEGTRYDKDKKRKSDKFCKENNMLEYKNLLCPRVKGLHLLINNIENLGSVIDLTINIEKIKNQNNYLLDTLKKDFGNTHIIAEELIIKKNIQYNEFKNYLYNYWYQKDNKLSNNLKGNETIEIEYSNIYLCILLIILYLMLYENIGNYIFIIIIFLVLENIYFYYYNGRN